MNTTANTERQSVRPGDHRLGDPNAGVILIEYGDFQCPTCKQAAPAVDLLRHTHGERLLFVFRHYPLEHIHQEALIAAEAAECAAAQGKFWEMHAALFANQNHLRMNDLEHHAGSIGLDMDRFRAEMQSRAHLARVRADMVLGQEAGVRSTPAFFLNDRFQDVSFGLCALHDAVQASIDR